MYLGVRSCQRKCRNGTGQRWSQGTSTRLYALAAINRLEHSDAQRIQTAISSGLRSAFKLPGEVVIDEWLDSYQHGAWYRLEKDELKEHNEYMERVRVEGKEVTWNAHRE